MAEKVAAIQKEIAGFAQSLQDDENEFGRVKAKIEHPTKLVRPKDYKPGVVWTGTGQNFQMKKCLAKKFYGETTVDQGADDYWLLVNGKKPQPMDSDSDDEKSDDDFDMGMKKNLIPNLRRGITVLERKIMG